MTDNEDYPDVMVPGARPPGTPLPTQSSSGVPTPTTTSAAVASPTPPIEPEPAIRQETAPIPNVAPPDRPTAEAAAGPDIAGPHVHTDLSGVENRLEDLHNAVQGFHDRAEQYEVIIRKMQSKIEDLQSDQVRTLLKPVINRLANLYTEATSAAQRAADRGDAKAQKDFGYFADEIEEGLELLDIESLDTKVGDAFDAAVQAARGTVDTEDPALDRTVAALVRQGFSYAGAERPLLPSVVKVFKYTGAASPAATEPTSSEGAS